MMSTVGGAGIFIVFDKLYLNKTHFFFHPNNYTKKIEIHVLFYQLSPSCKLFLANSSNFQKIVDPFHIVFNTFIYD